MLKCVSYLSSYQSGCLRQAFGNGETESNRTVVRRQMQKKSRRMKRQRNGTVLERLPEVTSNGGGYRLVMREESGQEGWPIRVTASRLTTVHEMRASHAIPGLPFSVEMVPCKCWLNCGNCGVMGIDAERRSGETTGWCNCAEEIHDNSHAATGKE